MDNTTVNQAAGYYNAFDLSAVDTDLASGNIRSTVSIYGVAGDPNVVNTSSGDAAAADIKDGKKAWVGGAEVTGNIPTQTVSNTTVSQLAGYYDAFDLSVVDTDLVSGNIRSTVSIYGVAGNPNVVNTSSGDAAAGDILQGMKAWVDGAEVTGNIAIGSNVNGPDGSKTFNIPDGFYSGSKECIASDTDLLEGNIKQGVDLFGVTGVLCRGLPATGQTECWCWDGDSWESCDCTGTGQDGEYQLGCLPAVDPSSAFWREDLTGFKNNNDGTVTDNLTGLIWLKNANCFGERTWTQALSDANTLSSGECSLNDGSQEGEWRLPNFNELRTLDFSEPLFTDVQGGDYWSSTTKADDTSYAWRVDMAGNVGWWPKANASSMYVWPVRDGQ